MSTIIDPREGWVKVGDLPEPKDPPFILADVLHESITIMYGRPKAGKTALSLSLADCMVRGESWFGHALREPRSVAYWGLDPAQDKSVRRWVTAAYPALKTMPFTSRKPGKYPHHWHSYADELQSQGTDFIIVDNLLRLMPSGRSLRDDEAVGEVLDNLQVFDEYGISILLLAHSGKPGEDGSPKVTPLGSTATEAWGRHFLRVEADKTKTGGKKRTIFSYGNDLGREDDLKISFRITDNGPVADEKRDYEAVDKTLAAIIDGQPWKSQTAIAEALGMSQPQVSRLLAKGGYTLTGGNLIHEA